MAFTKQAPTIKTPPAQMLLLFLTLVLLGGSASQKSPNPSTTIPAEGISFVISKEGQLISGIRIHIGISGYLSSLQVQHGNDWSPIHGSINGSLQEITWNTNESIIQVEGSNDNTKCLLHIAFRTNHGRKLEFGKVGPNQFKAFPTKKGKALTSIFGQYESTCISSLEFDWIYPEPKPPTKTTNEEVPGQKQP